uniref:Uncharacterized protein n=1 Tax=Callorhinchus milii TaxID=7868 RepID=A0A4W3GM60_CALMI
HRWPRSEPLRHKTLSLSPPIPPSTSPLPSPSSVAPENLSLCSVPRVPSPSLPPARGQAPSLSSALHAALGEGRCVIVDVDVVVVESVSVCLFSDGHHNSSDLWGPSGPIAQGNYGGVQGPPPSHMSQSNSYNTLHPTDRLNYTPSDVNTPLPPVTSFHRSSGTGAPFVTSPHTPPLNVSDTIMGKSSVCGTGG